MDPQSWPTDPVQNAALVLRALDDIDESSDEDYEALLEALLCAAWGSEWARDQ